VNLLEVDAFWHQMIRQRIHPELNSRRDVRRKIADAKRRHAGYFDRRFIYFICSRHKVRFSVTSQARLSMAANQLLVHLEIHGQQAVVQHSVPADRFLRIDGSGRPHLPQVENSEVAITFSYPGSYRETMSVHDFLLTHEIDLGFGSYVHYVGLTKNPDTRPLSGRHDGRARTLARLQGTERDVLFFYNTFAVRYLADDPALHARFWVSNAMSDDVDILAEGLTLEKLFIGHFLPDCQGDLESELTQLNNRLGTLHQQHNVARVNVDFEVDSTSDYYSFYSQHVPLLSRSAFTLNLR
jgi:hypothetical protein